MAPNDWSVDRGAPRSRPSLGLGWRCGEDGMRARRQRVSRPL